MNLRGLGFAPKEPVRWGAVRRFAVNNLLTANQFDVYGLGLTLKHHRFPFRTVPALTLKCQGSGRSCPCFR